MAALGKVVVLGAGAVGSLFGARLASAGESVLLIGRPEHVAAVRARGVTVEGVQPGTFEVEAFSALARGTEADAVLVTVKSFDLEEALAGLARSVGPVPTALLGNGLGLEGIAERSLSEHGWPKPARWLVRVVHTVPATLLGPGTVRASGEGELVFAEAARSDPAREAAEVLVELFRHARFTVRESPAFELELWRKVAVNAAINPVTAVRGVTNGALESGEARAEAERLLLEAVRVAEASRVGLTVEVARGDFDRVVRATAENRSSMLQDLDRGRPTEIDAISGEIYRRGQRLGLELPATAAMIARVHRAAAERSRSPQRS